MDGTTVADAIRLIGVVCMILASPARMSGTHWFLFIVIIAFIATAIWVFIYFLSVREALNFPVNWVFSELLNTVVFALLYLVVSIIQLNAWTGLYNPQFKDPNIAAGVSYQLSVLTLHPPCLWSIDIT
ncbi:uncharacterized protein LOC113472772 [Diaphorina citri]|uniref:Uncharacterized protein LOC113472772 n=1 Tax=Diaphorina citri TaxID=121845 RepID=A0A3Q0JJ04_DIACI|nr:uncharacterized protein LOC113472772 [Diaphorina citri]